MTFEHGELGNSVISDPKPRERWRVVTVMESEEDRVESTSEEFGDVDVSLGDGYVESKGDGVIDGDASESLRRRV